MRLAQAVEATDYEMIGGALRGFALVSCGDVAAGMRQLDEVNAAVLAGELTDPVAIALSGCYLVGACERVRDADRAGQWCRRLKALLLRLGIAPAARGVPDAVPSMCVWRGDWSEAEKELLTATDELVASRPGMSGEGQARLGELRRRQGRFDDADSAVRSGGESSDCGAGTHRAQPRSGQRATSTCALRSRAAASAIEESHRARRAARACGACGIGGWIARARNCSCGRSGGDRE